MATVDQVWRAIFPPARAFGSDDARQRQVAWVRVLKPRTPAFDALGPDDLALLPAAALASLAGLGLDEHQVVEAVIEARASCVLVVGDTAPVLRAAELAGQLGLAGFVLREGDVAALERSAIAFVINARAELEARAGELEKELEAQALAGAGADGLAATIARFLARPVAIEAADGTLLAMYAPVDSPAAAPWLPEYLRRRRGAALRVPLPSAGAGAAAAETAAGGEPGLPARRTSSALVLVGPSPPTELERICCARVAPFLALALGGAAPTDAGRTAGAGARASEQLPAAGPPWVAIVARQLEDDAPTTAAQRERIRDQLRRLEPARRLSLRGDASSLELRVVAAPDPADPGGLRLAERISRHLGRPVAASLPFSSAEERAVREAQARATLDAHALLSTPNRPTAGQGSGSTVAREALLPAYQLLAALPAMPDAERHARALLAPLLTARPTRDAQALATLRAVLDHPGMAEAAAALGIHRNTLAYRLAGLERRTGWQLSDPALRFALALAVRLVQSDQTRGPADAHPRARPAATRR